MKTLAFLQMQAMCLECSNLAVEGPTAEHRAKEHTIKTGHQVGIEKKETYILKRVLGLWTARAGLDVEAL